MELAVEEVVLPVLVLDVVELVSVKLDDVAEAVVVLEPDVVDVEDDVTEDVVVVLTVLVL